MKVPDVNVCVQSVQMNVKVERVKVRIHLRQNGLRGPGKGKDSAPSESQLVGSGRILDLVYQYLMGLLNSH